MDPGALLREARERAGLTQAELAERACVARSVVTAYEKGHRSPGIALLSRLLAAADCQLKVELERWERTSTTRCATPSPCRHRSVPAGWPAA